MRTVLAAFLLTWLALAPNGAETSAMPKRLQVGVVQMPVGQTIAENRKGIVSWSGRTVARCSTYVQTVGVPISSITTSRLFSGTNSNTWLS